MGCSSESWSPQQCLIIGTLVPVEGALHRIKSYLTLRSKKRKQKDRLAAVFPKIHQVI